MRKLAPDIREPGEKRRRRLAGSCVRMTHELPGRPGRGGSHAPEHSAGVTAGGNPTGDGGCNIINLGGGRNPITLTAVIALIEQALTESRREKPETRNQRTHQSCAEAPTHPDAKME